MSASSDDPPFHPTTLEALDQSCEEMTLRLELATQRINRLLATAFYNQMRAQVGLKSCLRNIGVAGTLDILAGKSLLPRSHYFGLLRGFQPFWGDRRTAKLALQELPEAIREREVLSHKRADLVNTRRTLLEQAATRDPHVPDPGRGGNSVGRGRGRIR